jgi:hypothetical protein
MERVQAATDMASTTAEQTKRGPRLQDLIPHCYGSSPMCKSSTALQEQLDQK